MYRLDKRRGLVLDSADRVVGQIVNGRFNQSVCDPIYKAGLSPRELESISETMQRCGVQF
jgi:hypothetical protein